MIQSYLRPREAQQGSGSESISKSTKPPELDINFKQRFEALEKIVSRGFQKVLSKLEDGKDPLPTLSEFHFLVALNVLEGLVLDQTFTLARVNLSLKDRRSQRQFYRERLEALPDHLQESFKRLFRNFSSGDFAERARRFAEINHFRKQLLWASSFEQLRDEVALETSKTLATDLESQTSLEAANHEDTVQEASSEASVSTSELLQPSNAEESTSALGTEPTPKTARRKR